MRNSNRIKERGYWIQEIPYKHDLWPDRWKVAYSLIRRDGLSSTKPISTFLRIIRRTSPQLEYNRPAKVLNGLF